MSLIAVSAHEAGSTKPIFQQFFHAADFKGDPSFFTFFVTNVVPAADLDFDTVDMTKPKAAVRLREKGSDPIEVRKLEDKIRPYLRLDIGFIMYTTKKGSWAVQQPAEEAEPAVRAAEPEIVDVGSDDDDDEALVGEDSLVETYELCRVVRIFDPNFAAAHATPAFVDALSAVTPLHNLGFVPKLKAELPVYLAAEANAPAFDRADVDAYTEGLLTWWRTNGGTFKEWALAARIVFAISPTSASCERVFSLLKLMFGDQQLSTLADSIRAAIMLRYNNRTIG